VLNQRELRLHKPLGRGGSGVVWDGEIKINGGWKRVAIKEYLGPDRRRRAEHEAAIMRTLQGRHVPELHDVDPEQGLLVMEFCDGLGLDSLLERCALREAAIPLSAVIGLGFRIAEALEDAHRATTDRGTSVGLAHLDLKPGNVLLERDGVRLLDFGISAPLNGVADGSGTPGYMAPEQQQRQPVGPFTDIYALGVMLSELSGVQPGSPLGSSPVQTRCPELTALIRQFTSPDPTRRPQNATHARAALRDLLGSVDGGIDELRLLYSIVTQSHDTRAASPPEESDWGRFVEAFSARPRGPTLIRPSTQPSPGTEAPAIAHTAPDSAPSPARTPRARWLVMSVLALLVSVAGGVWLGVPDALFGRRIVDPSHRGKPASTGIPATQPGAKGSARLRSRHPFELQLDGKVTGPPAKTHVLTLDPGTHRVLARCTGCPPGMDPVVEELLAIQAGTEKRLSIRFD